MNYYICGYNNNKIIISKPLNKRKKYIIFNDKIYKNIIESNTVFDFSLVVNEKDKFEFFILCCREYDKVYNFLVRHRNTKLYDKMNIFLNFNLEIKSDNFCLNKVYYEINKEYPYKKYLYNILIDIIPTELIFIIYKYLDRNVIISFLVNKSRHCVKYYFNMPKIFY